MDIDDLLVVDDIDDIPNISIVLLLFVLVLLLLDNILNGSSSSLSLARDGSDVTSDFGEEALLEWTSIGGRGIVECPGIPTFRPPELDNPTPPQLSPPSSLSSAVMSASAGEFDIIDLDPCPPTLDDNLEEYNVTFSNRMNLVFFQDALTHTARIGRILAQPRGNAMLIGVGGSGKQSLTKMASFVCGMSCLSIEINRGYGITEFREDIKKFMIKTGVDGEDTGSYWIPLDEVNKENTKKALVELVRKKDPTYSALSLFFIIDNALISDQAKINDLFDIIIDDVSLENEIKNLIIYKKALYNADKSEENQLLDIVKPIINSESVWKSHGLYLMAEFFYSKNEKEKAKEFFSQIISLENANEDLRAESQKRLNRDLSE